MSQRAFTLFPPFPKIEVAKVNIALFDVFRVFLIYDCGKSGLNSLKHCLECGLYHKKYQYQKLVTSLLVDV